MNANRNSRLYATLPSLRGSHSRAQINLSALRRNYIGLKEYIKAPEYICVVKADAYGHGAVETVRVLFEEGCRCFAVSCIEEALAIRPSAKDAEILILGNIFPSHAELLVQHKLTTTVFSLENARSLSHRASEIGQPIGVHIKLDTGMNRLGFPAWQPQVCVREISELFTLKGLSIEGIYSHFACADEPDKQHTVRQAERFLCVTDALEKQGLSLGMKHICNSAGALRFPEYHLDAVRLGLALYGYLPDGTEKPLLESVMSLKSFVTHIHTLQKGERVGYGGTYRAEHKRTIATLSIGYADGFLRAYTGASVTVHTQTGSYKAPIVGRICMDQCMIDVTDIPVRTGDEVTLFGTDVSELTELARRAGTIPYESLCMVSARVPREITELS